MSNVKEERRVAKIIGGIIGFAICCSILYYLIPIDPTKTYGWFGGMWQGGCAWINYLISLLVDNHYAKAPLHTTAYNVFWWISFILFPFQLLKVILRFITWIRSPNTN